MKNPLAGHNKPYFKLRKKKTPAVHATIPAVPWSVPGLCAAYNWPKGLAGGGVIAIVELGGGWVQSDIAAFFQSVNQPSPQITDVSVDGTLNNPNQNVGSADDPDYEVALDIEVSGAAYYAATGSRPPSGSTGRRTSRQQYQKAASRWVRRVLHLLGRR